MLGPVVCRLLGISELTINQSEVVMRGEVFGIQGESLLKFCQGLEEKLFLSGRIGAFHFRALHVSLPQFIDHLVILAEIKSAPIEFGVAVLENAAELGNGFVQKSILLI